IGCRNPSQKKLSKTLEQTNSLAILSVTDRCEPHFYPSSEFSWGSMSGGMCRGAGKGAEEAMEYPPYINLIAFFLTVPYEAVAGGVSDSGQMSNVLKSHFNTTLCNVFEEPDPGGRVARNIRTQINNYKPELQIQEVYWSGEQSVEYINISSSKKKAKIKEFCKSLGGSGEMLLVIQGVDFGLTGGTMENQESCFFMIVQAELVRGIDGKRIYHREFEYESPQHRFNEWEGHSRTLLKEQYHRACLDLGDRISKEVLGVEKHSQ
ncbi:MAG: hypothetical protein ACO20W_06625, partial [Anaerohalosphaeraceae bacterium]